MGEVQFYGGPQDGLIADVDNSMREYRFAHLNLKRPLVTDEVIESVGHMTSVYRRTSGSKFLFLHYE